MIIFLSGFQNVGKTTLGKQTAKKLKLPFYDTDDLVEGLYEQQFLKKKTCRQIYSEEGKEVFEILEYRCLESLVTISKAIIALGGGTIIPNNHARLIKDLGKVIYLQSSPKMMEKKILSQPTIPAYLNPNDILSDLELLLNARHPIYLRNADHVLLVDKKSESKIVEEIVHFYHLQWELASS